MCARWRVRFVQKRGAADAVLPSKLTNILAVGGNAVITADLGANRYPAWTWLYHLYERSARAVRQIEAMKNT